MRFPISELIFACVLLLVSQCATATAGRAEQEDGNRLPPIGYQVDLDGNGVYEAADLDQVPEPRQGMDQWPIDFYSTIRYPSLARENGIQGIVVLDVLIDEFGMVKNLGIQQSLYPVCDEEALRAFKISTKQGYTPAYLNGRALACRLSVPVGFWLN